MQICADSYWPEAHRLPVMAGSKIIFDLSSEGDVATDYNRQSVRRKLAPQTTWQMDITATLCIKPNLISCSSQIHVNCPAGFPPVPRNC